MGINEFELETDRLECKRIKQRKAFNSVWKRLIAIHQLDDCLVDEFLNAIEKVE